MSNCIGVKKFKYDTAFSKRTEKHTYRWILHNINSKLNVLYTCFKSPIFGKNGSKYEWQIICYPKGNKEKDYISIYLEQPTKFDVSVTSTIEGRNSDDEVLIQRQFENVFDKEVKDWGFPLFMKHSDLKRLTDDILVIKVDITTSTEEHICETKLGQDLKTALNNKIVTDVVLKTGDFELPVHKSILSARSPVFCAVFQHDTLENAKGCVQIDDIDKETLILLVDFIYTDKVIELSCDKAKALLRAADKYDLPDLIQICDDYLVDDINLSNVVDLLLFSDFLNVSRLRKECISFITENHWKFANNTRLDIVAEKSPKILLEMLLQHFRTLPRETKLHL